MFSIKIPPAQKAVPGASHIGKLSDGHGNDVRFDGVTRCVGNDTLVGLRCAGRFDLEGEGISVIAGQIAHFPLHAVEAVPLILQTITLGLDRKGHGLTHGAGGADGLGQDLQLRGQHLQVHGAAPDGLAAAVGDLAHVHGRTTDSTNEGQGYEHYDGRFYHDLCGISGR